MAKNDKLAEVFQRVIQTALKREQLDAYRAKDCPPGEEPPEAPMEFTSNCHPDTGIRLFYAQGYLFLRCTACDHPVCVIKVAE
jgi:hypothetical protein